MSDIKSPPIFNPDEDGDYEMTSQGAQIAFLCGNNRAVPITWKSKKLERVTKSPMTSETMALAESADAGHFVALMTRDLWIKNSPKSVLQNSFNFW